MSNKQRIYLFCNDEPKGKIHEVTDDQLEELKEDGWVESPEELCGHQEKEIGITVEQAQSANPQDLVKLVESLGFKVFSEEMLQAELNKAVSGVTIKSYTDEEIGDEASARGIISEVVAGDYTDSQILEECKRRQIGGFESTENVSGEKVTEEKGMFGEPLDPLDEREEKVDEIDDLLSRFNEDPESLTKDEHVTLGNTKYSLGLRSNMKEATLIEKITAAMVEAE